MLTETPGSVHEDCRFYECLDQFWYPMAKENDSGWTA